MELTRKTSRLHHVGEGVASLGPFAVFTGALFLFAAVSGSSTGSAEGAAA